VNVWHRRLGLVTAFIVMFLAITGILLNHAHRLGLDKRYVQANWVLRWYGFPAPDLLLSYRCGERWVSWSGSQLYVDDQAILQSDTAPIGTSAVKDGLVAVAFPQMVVLVGASGEIVERMGTESLPGTLRRIGATNGALVVQTEHGSFRSDENMLAWHAAASEASWSQPDEAPPALREQLAKAARGPGLSFERVLQDLHSGRLFGAWGPWLMDAAALAFIVLAATGLCYWWTRRTAITRPNARPRNDE
jgi:hypothetical protein